MLTPHLWFFRQVGLEHRLPTDVMEALKDQGRTERWGHGAKIYHQPEELELYLVLAGNVHIHDGTIGRNQLLKRGDMFGATANQPRLVKGPKAAIGHRVDLRAHDETTLCALSREAFRELTGEHLGQVHTSFGGLGKRKKTVAVPLLPLLFTTPMGRLSRVLLHIVEGQGHVEDDRGTYVGMLRPTKLAALTGLDKARVRLLLDHLGQDGVVKRSARMTVVPKMEKLREFAVQF